METEENEHDDYDILYNALKAAHEAFDDYIDNLGLDPSFWELEPITGHVLSINDFGRRGKIVLDKTEGMYDEEV